MNLQSRDELEQLLKHHYALKAQDSQYNKQLEELVQKIKNGHSTGDPITDFLIVNTESVDSDLGKRLYSLQKEINENQGKKVLVLAHHKTSREQTGCFGGGYLSINLELLQLGVINGTLNVDVNKEELLIPTGKYYSEDKLHEGPIQIPLTEIICIDNWGPAYQFGMLHGCMQGWHEHSQNTHKITVLFGDKTVDTYFRIPPWMFEGPLFEKIMHDIKKDNAEEWVAFYKKLPEKPAQYLCYTKALQALGLEVPPDFKQAYDTLQEKRKTEILEKLNQSVNNCKTSFDDLEKALKPNLAELVELGIADEPRLITMAPGMEVDFAKYIKGLCEKYNIKTEP
ncbi:MAG: hypothetical protein HY363_03220 [Candidatus Aenigmarchaeota archaeon]|nr:hypothetical protein [Candidatus Aenigmarchaeota archaeon]